MVNLYRLAKQQKYPYPITNFLFGIPSRMLKSLLIRLALYWIAPIISCNPLLILDDNEMETPIGKWR